MGFDDDEDRAQVLSARAAGKQRFLGLDMLVAQGVIVPRLETELLASTALELLRETSAQGGELSFVDVCCGSGNLACAIAAHLRHARGWATDVSPEAVQLARANVEHLGLQDRLTVLQGDLFAPLAPLGIAGTLDCVVCNPPYISTSRLERERAGLLEHEPRDAFDGGPYGLRIHQRVAREAASLLKDGAPLLLEIGAGQDQQVVQLLARTKLWRSVDLRRDSRGTARVAVARRASR